jgi:hypothetical protein
MVLEKDTVWEHRQKCEVDEHSKQYASCRQCGHKLQANASRLKQHLEQGKQYASCQQGGHKLQVNASRFKQHLVLTCTGVPNDVKSKNSDQVLKQSVATPR